MGWKELLELVEKSSKKVESGLRRKFPDYSISLFVRPGGIALCFSEKPSKGSFAGIYLFDDLHYHFGVFGSESYAKPLIDLLGGGKYDKKSREVISEELPLDNAFEAYIRFIEGLPHMSRDEMRKKLNGESSPSTSKEIYELYASFSMQSSLFYGNKSIRDVNVPSVPAVLHMLDAADDDRITEGARDALLPRPEDIVESGERVERNTTGVQLRHFLHTEYLALHYTLNDWNLVLNDARARKRIGKYASLLPESARSAKNYEQLYLGFLPMALRKRVSKALRTPAEYESAPNGYDAAYAAKAIASSPLLTSDEKEKLLEKLPLEEKPSLNTGVVAVDDAARNCAVDRLGEALSPFMSDDLIHLLSSKYASALLPDFQKGSTAAEAVIKKLSERMR